ncbi:hypothetical protein E4T45_03165, partial [Aureobasidium sp. EXF-8846]
MSRVCASSLCPKTLKNLHSKTRTRSVCGRQEAVMAGLRKTLLLTETIGKTRRWLVMVDWMERLDSTTTSDKAQPRSV